MLLAARTAEHEVTNQLALAVGYTELLARSPALPADLRPLAERAREGAQAAAGTIRRLSELTEIREARWGPSGGATIVLGRAAVQSSAALRDEATA